MKIDSTVNSLPPITGATVSPKVASPVSSPVQGSQVQLSAQATALLGAESVIKNSPVSDASRVAEIKQAIAEGRFSINPEKIADGLLSSVRQMLHNQPSY